MWLQLIALTERTLTPMETLSVALIARPQHLLVLQPYAEMEPIVLANLEAVRALIMVACRSGYDTSHLNSSLLISFRLNV